MAPAWLYKNITRDETENLITEAGLDDGRFLVRTREGKPGYVLCVVFKGKPTHHLITANDEGHLTVNKKTFGGHTKISKLVKVLSTQQSGWPVALDKPVKKVTESAASSGGSSSGGGWLAGPISRTEAEAAVVEGGLEDGNFTVRTRPGKPGEWVLCVVFKGKPTHHLVTTLENGSVAVNKKTYGDHKTIEGLISQLQNKTNGWPILLSGPRGGQTAPEPVSPVPEPQPAPPVPEPEQEKPAPAIPEQSTKSNAITEQYISISPDPTPTTSGVTLESNHNSVVPASSTDDSETTLQLARAVLTLDKKVTQAEAKLDELHALIARLERA